MKKVIGSILTASVLILGVTDDTQSENAELQKAINYKPTIKVEFKAVGTHAIRNVNNSNDVLYTDKTLNVGAHYMASFENDYLVNLIKL